MQATPFAHPHCHLLEHGLLLLRQEIARVTAGGHKRASESRASAVSVPHFALRSFDCHHRLLRSSCWTRAALSPHRLFVTKRSLATCEMPLLGMMLSDEAAAEAAAAGAEEEEAEAPEAEASVLSLSYTQKRQHSAAVARVRRSPTGAPPQPHRWRDRRPENGRLAATRLPTHSSSC